MSTLMTAPNLLVRAGEILAAQGWCQDGAYEYKPGREIDEGPLDLAAALAKAAGVDLVSRAAGRPVGVHADAVMILARHVFGAEVDAIRYREPWGWLDQLTDWQDESARTVGQVIAAARGAAEAATGAEGPFYPQPGSPVPDRPGYLVAECGHSVAGSEWRAGFRTCERCNFGGQDGSEDEPESSALPDALRAGELYSGRDDDLLFCIASEQGIGFVTNRGTWVPLDEAERAYAPLTLVRPVEATVSDAALPDVQELAAAIEEALNLPSPEPAPKAMDGWFQLMTRRASRVRSALTHVTNPGLLDADWALRELRKIPIKTPVNYPTEDGEQPPTPYDGLIGKWVTVTREGARHPERFKLLRVEDGALWVTAPMHGEDYILLDDVAAVELVPAGELGGGAE